ncbi:phenoloxidase-activating factor 2 [Drosophila sechellia]|uniref:phenoloxidase-activating factor 2 n=1 Tax=Drosophila sechellia TaxID=7238 RepID=UPI0013DE698F|nr:phenoloxidase-activating factor 2 [Drosophila sechellia]
MRSGSKPIVDLKVRAKSGCHYLEVCCHPDDMLPPMNGSIPLGYKQCGIGNVGGIFMDLIGGRLETSLAEYLYMVAILDTVVLIKAGDWDLSTDSEFVPHVDRGVRYRIVHQQFNWDSIKNNIALLVLVEQFPRVQHIIPICLDHNGVDLDYDNCFVTVLTAIPRPEQPMYTKGAPLVCPTESSRYYVVGAWSTSLNGAIQFTDIRKLKEWIHRELQLYNIVL